jgi:hypothetical protein
MGELLSFSARASRFTREPFGQVEPLGQEWIVKGLMPATGLGFIVGPPAAGKSFAAIDFLLRIASGRQVLERRTRCVGVAYVASEAANGVRKRLKAWRKANGGNAHLELIPQAVNLRDEEDVADLANTLRDMRADLGADDVRLGAVVIDTVAASMPGGNENDGADMSDVLARMQRLAIDLELLVLLVAHTGKDETRGIRGWSGQTGAADMILTVERDKDDPALRIVTASKIKDGEDGDRFAFRLETVVIGRDDDGEDITSAVPVYEAAPGRRAKRARPLNPAEQLVLQAISFVTDHGATHPAPTAPGVPAQQRAIARADVRARALASGFAVADEKPNTTNVRFGRALQGIVAKEKVRIEGELLWLV